MSDRSDQPPAQTPETPLDLSRRDFLAAGAGAVALSVLDDGCGPAGAADKVGTHAIPADKNLSRSWVASLFAKGKARVYRGEELKCIGMPVGGICAGQLYLRGDGTLAGWQIFNHPHFTGFGATSYETYTPASP